MLISDLILSIRQLANLENSKFITDSEILNFINQAHKDLYNLVVKTNENYFILESTLTNNTALPTDCFKIVGIQIDENKDSAYFAKRVSLLELKTSYTANYNRRYEYTLVNNTIKWNSVPSSNTLFYIPYASSYLNINSPIPEPYAHFSNFYIYSAVVKCLSKEESDARYYISLLEQEKNNVVFAVTNRDESGAQSIVDVYSVFSNDVE